MRKHFLILMLMALLPLAGWAAAADLITKPALATGLVYDGTEQTLLTGEATLPPNYLITPGCVVYTVTDNGTTPPTLDFDDDGVTTDFPTATNAGEYYVWYRVKGDGTANYSDGAWTLVSPLYEFTRISPATPTITPSLASGLKYTGSAQKPFTGVATADFGTAFKYSVDGTNWKDTYNDAALVLTNAGLHPVYVKVLGDGVNGNWIETVQEIPFTIAPKSLADNDVAIALKNTFVNPVYSGTAKELTLDDFTVTWNKAGTDPILLSGTTDYAIKDYLDANSVATNINAGTATCNLQSGSNGNFTGGSLTFTIDAKAITEGMFTIVDVAYTGKDITQADLAGATGFVAKDGSLPDLVAKDAEHPNGDFTLTTTAKDVKANGAKYNVTIAGTNNYKGTLTAKFKVTPITLHVDAKPYTVGRGAAVTNDNLVNGAYYEFRAADFVEGENVDNVTITGAPTMGLKDGVNTNTQGTFDGGIEVKTAGTLAATNYIFTVGNAANLIVNATNFTAAFKDDLAYYYKDVVPDFATWSDYIELTGAPTTAITSITIKMYDGETLMTAGADLTVGKTYTLKVTATEIDTDYKLDGTIADKEITVQRYPLTVIAQDQSIAYGEGMHITNANADAYVIIKDGVTNTQYTKGAFNTKFGIAEYKPYFIDNLEWIGDKTISSPGQVKVNLKETYDNGLFDVTTENGTVSFNNVSTDLVLERVAIPNAAAVDDASNTAAARIAEYHNAKNIDVTFTFPNHTMKKETWYSWVLPFKTSVKEISEAFGYAVVDILNADGASKKSDVKFSLHMGEIAAGQPFILKVYQNITPDDFINGVVKFNDVQIINGPTIDTDANECQFIGTYTGKYGLNSDGTEYLFRLGQQSYSMGGADSQIRPLGAYIKFAQASEAHYIYIEEPDGSTTAISSIAADGEMIPAQGWYTVNGVKLETAPTEKGIYINNGKKIVIK